MPQYLVKPTNRILARGDSDDCILEMEVGANATAAKMLPGRIVIYDAAEGAVKEAGAASKAAVGVLEVKSGMKISDNYAVGDPCNVIYKIGALVVLTLISGSAAVTDGDGIATAADGKAAKAGNNECSVAQALQSADPAAADKTIVCQWKPEQYTHA